MSSKFGVRVASNERMSFRDRTSHSDFLYFLPAGHVPIT